MCESADEDHLNSLIHEGTMGGLTPIFRLAIEYEVHLLGSG
jgi:hypothetical protein